MSAGSSDRAKVATDIITNHRLMEVNENGPGEITEVGADVLSMLLMGYAQKYGYRKTARILVDFLREAQASEALRRLFSAILDEPMSLILVDMDDAAERKGNPNDN